MFPLTAGRVSLQKAGLGLAAFWVALNHAALSAQGTDPALLAVPSSNRAVAESQLPLGDIPYFGSQCFPSL